MERMRTALVPLKWTSGWCGCGWRGQPLRVMDNLLFRLALILSILLLGGSYPETGAQRTAGVEDLFCLSIPTEGSLC
jgi:hypothetical protein